MCHTCQSQIGEERNLEKEGDDHVGPEHDDGDENDDDDDDDDDDDGDDYGKRGNLYLPVRQLGGFAQAGGCPMSVRWEKGRWI